MKKKFKKNSTQNTFSKLSVFSNQKFRFKKKCPLSGKGAPKIDYKNIKLLKKYTSENGKILPSRITSVSLNLRKLGNIGEIINVRRGYARNFLIPQKKALFASDKNIKEVEKIKNDLNKKDLEKKKAAKEIVEKLKNKTFEIKKLVTENKELYGSVKPTEISKLLKEKINIELSSSLIQPVNEIKSVGEFKVVLNLHSEIECFIKIKVLPDEQVK